MICWIPGPFDMLPWIVGLPAFRAPSSQWLLTFLDVFFFVGGGGAGAGAGGVGAWRLAPRLQARTYIAGLQQKYQVVWGSTTAALRLQSRIFVDMESGLWAALEDWTCRRKLQPVAPEDVSPEFKLAVDSLQNKLTLLQAPAHMCARVSVGAGLLVCLYRLCFPSICVFCCWARQPPRRKRRSTRNLRLSSRRLPRWLRKVVLQGHLKKQQLRLEQQTAPKNSSSSSQLRLLGPGRGTWLTTMSFWQRAFRPLLQAPQAACGCCCHQPHGAAPGLCTAAPLLQLRWQLAGLPRTETSQFFGWSVGGGIPLACSILLLQLLNG